MGGKQAKKTNKKLPMMSILAVGNSNAGKTALIRGYENLMNNGNCFYFSRYSNYTIRVLFS